MIDFVRPGGFLAGAFAFVGLGMAGSGKGRTSRPVRAKSARGVDAREAFLAALAEGFSATSAARKASLARSTVYNWRDTDPDFAKAWAEAEDAGSDLLEDEAMLRGTDGVLEPVYHGGKLVGEVRKKSDTLLMFLLKARRPERFRDRVSTELSGPNGGPIQATFAHDLSDLSGKTADELSKLFSDVVRGDSR